MSQNFISVLSPVVQFFADTGGFLSLGKVYAYEAGSTTPAPTYSDAAGATPNAVPVALDVYGKAVIYLGPIVYKIDVQNAAGVSQTGYPRDNVVGSLWTGALIGVSALSPGINANGYANALTSTVNKAGSGAHPIFTTLAINAPTIGAGASSLAEATTVYIPGAPTGATANYALHIAGGLAKLDGSSRAPFALTSASSVLTISSNVITPTGSVHHVGAGLIKTITVPAVMATPGTITIIPDAAFTYDATGNILGSGTATTNRAMTFTWDGSKWAASY